MTYTHKWDAEQNKQRNLRAKVRASQASRECVCVAKVRAERERESS